MRWLIRGFGIIIAVGLIADREIIAGLMAVVIAFAMSGAVGSKRKKSVQSAAAQQFEAAMRRRQEMSRQPQAGLLVPPRPAAQPTRVQATRERQESMMTPNDPDTNRERDADNPRLPDATEFESNHSTPNDPYDATPRIDDAPVREMARSNDEMLARSQESMNELRAKIQAEADQARAHAAEALATTVGAAGLGNAAQLDGSKIRETASSLPPLSGSGAARDLPWDKPLQFASFATTGGTAGLADRYVEAFEARNGFGVFRNVRLADFGSKAPVVVTHGNRAVIIDVLDLPSEGLRWLTERGKAVLAGGTTRSDQPGRIAETIDDWSHDNPDADFASVLTLAEGTLGEVSGESVQTLNLLNSGDVVDTVVDWLTDGGTDQAVAEKLNTYLQSRANRF